MTPFATDQLAEAQEAWLAATRRYPLLAWDGLREAPLATDNDGELFLRQIATGLAFLRAHPPTKPTSSYVLKHEAERWGQEHGMSPYVPGGALLTAAIYLGLRLGRQRGLHTDIGPARRERAA